MCDTIVSTPSSSKDGLMILGKNSDREPNEAQNITFVPAMDHPFGSCVKCTYIEIPQIKHTYAVLLSRPFWMFGAEMGVNEHGVAIGNEAVFTKEKYHKKNDALLGMDMLRLALERSRNATEAINVITNCIGKYGQGGIHTMGGTRYYHNSFIIADPVNAYILETAGVHWVFKKVADRATISNCLTIEDDYDELSHDLKQRIGARQESNKKRGLNFKRDFSDTVYTHFARGRIRKSCSYDLLSQKKGTITSIDMMQILRYHNVEEPYQPGQKPMERICLHAGGLISSQTVGSMVAVLKEGRPPLVYFTGTSSPCMSIFKPHTITKDQKIFNSSCLSTESKFGGYDLYGASANIFEEKNLWWCGEDIHRRVLMNYAGLMPLVNENRDGVEKKIILDVEKTWIANNEKECAEACTNYTNELIVLNKKISELIINEFEKQNRKKHVPWWFAMQWSMINAKAGMNI